MSDMWKETRACLEYVCMCCRGGGESRLSGKKRGGGREKNENEGSFLKEMGRKIWGMEDRS